MKRKGFTLVELLIVIAILGALASMMSLSGTNATASARAATIVNDLKTLKTAALLMYNDYYLSSGDSGFQATSFQTKSNDYLDAAALKALSKDYAVFITPATAASANKAAAASKWWAIYKFDTGSEAVQIKKLLAARASKLGLWGGTALNAAPTIAPFSNQGNQVCVGIQIR